MYGKISYNYLRGGNVFVVCVCVCWSGWQKHHFWYGGISWPYLGQVWVSMSSGQGQGHTVENANFVTRTSILYV